MLLVVSVVALVLGFVIAAVGMRRNDKMLVLLALGAFAGSWLLGSAWWDTASPYRGAVTGASGESVSVSGASAGVTATGGGGGGNAPVRYRADMSEIDARLSCQQAIRNHLIAPSTARFSTYYRRDAFWNDLMGQWQYTVNVEAQNAFGVPIMSTWSCTLPLGGHPRVELKD